MSNLSFELSEKAHELVIVMLSVRWVQEPFLALGRELTPIYTNLPSSFASLTDPAHCQRNDLVAETNADYLEMSVSFIDDDPSDVLCQSGDEVCLGRVCSML